VAEVVGSFQGKYAIAVAQQFGGRQRHGNGKTFWARGYAVSTVGCAEEYLRRESRNQEQLDIHGRDEDGDFEESRRTCIWQPLGLLTTVKPPALRERHDS
jgi:putative transposase